MGVSGCGKTTIGKLLARALKVSFFDADDFHPKHNVEKMERGEALTDEDRFPWLEALTSLGAKNEKAVLSCSALKESYRVLLASKSKVHWVYLKGEYALIKSRMERRQNHFMPSNLLQSQFDALEEPKYGICISIADTPAQIVKNIIDKLKLAHE